MTSVAPSDSESNVSGFISYSDKNFKYLYCSMIEILICPPSPNRQVKFQNMELINQDILQIEKNLKNIVNQAGPMENQLAVLLQALPKPKVELVMETD